MEWVASRISEVSPAFRTLGWVLLGSSLLIAAYLAYQVTTEGTFAREVVVAGLGAVFTVASMAAVAFFALFSELRRLRESRTLRRFSGSSWRRQSLRAGRMRIPDIVVVASCTQGRPWTNNSSFAFSEFVDSRELRGDLVNHRDQVLKEVLRRAEYEQVALTNGQCVDLRSAQVKLVKDQSGKQRAHYLFTPAFAEYFDFVSTTANMDASIDDGPTFRELVCFEPRGMHDVESLPAMAMIGADTVVVTSDNRLVLGCRGRTMIAGQQDAEDERTLVHIVAEGASPDDTNRQGRFDPRVTAKRGLSEELSIGDSSGELGRVVELVETGLFFDQLRWQPCFAFLARIDLTWDELLTAAASAPDYWEVERLESVPFSIQEQSIRKLLIGEHPDLVLASNHAAAALWFGLVYEHGFFEVRDVLSRPN